MSTTQQFRISLIDLVRARYPVLLVESHEEGRVLEAITSVATDPALRRVRQVQVFTLTAGLQPVGSSDPVNRSQQDASGRDALAQALSAAAKASEPTIFVFFDAHHSLAPSSGKAEPGVVRAILDVARQFKHGPVPHTLVLVAPSMTIPLDLEKVITVVELPLPDEGEINAVLQDILEVNAAAVEIKLSEGERQSLVKAALGLTLDEAENAFARAIAKDRKLDASDINLVYEEKRQTVRKSGLLEFIPSAVDPNEVGGLENLKKWLEMRNGAWLSESSQWSVAAPKGVLITGVPGCGKSLTAKTMSSLWNLPLLRLDVGKIFAGLVGSSEQNMRGALRLAEAVSPSVLWIDEIEKGFGQAGGDSGTSTRVFGTFLTWMQEKTQPVFVIATANKIDSLPPELLRKGRFDEIFFVDLPTAAERDPIWRVHLSRRLRSGLRVAEGFDLSEGLISELVGVSEGYSGAEIEQAVVSACFSAFADRRGLVADDLFRAVTGTVPLSKTQAEQIVQIREWAERRAVAATSTDDRNTYKHDTGIESEDVASWRGGRAIDF